MVTAPETPEERKDTLTGSSKRTSHVVKVIVHPLVLLSVVDHYNRLHKTGHKHRVVGCLLGNRLDRKGSVIDISNSFAVPFDEDPNDSSVWFFDHNYLETMFSMFKKVNARERIVGWYHTGPKLHPNDIHINKIVNRYCQEAVASAKFTGTADHSSTRGESVLLIVDIGCSSDAIQLPTTAYVAASCEDELLATGGSTVLRTSETLNSCETNTTLEHVITEIGTEEAEEVGVEHLLRDVKDSSAGTLAQRVTERLLGLRGLLTQISAMSAYLRQVVAGTLPVNHQITYALQDVFNLLPNVASESMSRALYVQTNDQMLVVYLSSLTRAIIALHDLINNKLTNQDGETQPLAVGKKEKAESENKKEDKSKRLVAGSNSL